jgi:hypothetical protein
MNKTPNYAISVSNTGRQIWTNGLKLTIGGTFDDSLPQLLSEA